MTLDGAPRSRRSLLAAVVGAGAAAMASALGRPAQVRAADGDPLIAGSTVTSTSITRVQSASASPVLAAESTATGTGIYGSSVTSLGVSGYSGGSIAVLGSSAATDMAAILGGSIGQSTGVLGYSGPQNGTPAAALETGVFGYAVLSADSRGVVGRTLAGEGVRGEATTGTGMVAASDDGPGIVATSLLSVAVTGASGLAPWPDPITPSTGVYGISLEGHGVYGASQEGAGLYGANHAVGIAAVVGQGNAGTGVHGHGGAVPMPTAPSETGLFGTAAGSGTGVSATSDTGTTMKAVSLTGPAAILQSGAEGVPSLLAESVLDTGVMGYSGSLFLVPPSVAKAGVFGYAAQDSSARGVVAVTTAGTGLHGYAGPGAPPAPATKTGVYSRCDLDANARGVSGYSSVGRAIYGGTSVGSALHGVATGSAGYALRTSGRLRLDKTSGASTIPAGANNVVVAPGIDLTAAAIVLATLQGSAGGTTTVHRVAIDTVADTFRIYLTANSVGAVRVGWIVIG